MSQLETDGELSMESGVEGTLQSNSARGSGQRKSPRGCLGLEII